MNSIDKINKTVEILNSLNYKIIGEDEKIVDLVRGIL
jgi:hypothetical protein